MECLSGWLPVIPASGGLSEECSILSPVDRWLLKDEGKDRGRWTPQPPNPAPGATLGCRKGKAIVTDDTGSNLAPMLCDPEERLF